ncbi:MAG: hypothetical protein FJ390_02985 [Verrucomicrobia bacterium]|nr:hypothetical protein [Verrucomicrobiota bacterium]
MEFPNYHTPRDSPNYAHVDERTYLNPKQNIQKTSDINRRSSQISSAADPTIRSTATDSSRASILPHFSDVQKFFSYFRSADHPYQPVPDQENAIEIISPLHEQPYQRTSIDSSISRATSWPPTSEGSKALLKKADRINMNCWNEFYKLSSPKTTQNPTLFLQLLEKNIFSYQEYTSSREVHFQAAKEEFLQHNNPSLIPSLIDLSDHSHDASINYLLRLQSAIERLEKLVVETNKGISRDQTFSVAVETPTSGERERERLLSPSTQPAVMRELTETISSLKEKISTSVDAYSAKIEADISFLERVLEISPNSLQEVEYLIGKLKGRQTWLQQIRDHQQSNTERLHQLFQQHLNDLVAETAKADREFKNFDTSNRQEALAAFSKSRMRLWEATQSFKGLHQDYDPTQDYLETVYGRNDILKQSKEKFLGPASR